MENVKMKRKLLPQQHWAELIEGAYWGSDTNGTTNTLILPDRRKVYLDTRLGLEEKWQVIYYVGTAHKSRHEYTGKLADAKHWVETMIATGAI
jgi:hypothetical protein